MKYTSAVILAAGSGTRFGGSVKKQFVSVGGESAVLRCAKAFDNCDVIDEIIVVGNPEDIAESLSDYSFRKPLKTALGGETRRQSALHGFDAVSSRAKYVVIHDAARCLVTPELICETVRAAYKFRAAAAAEKVVDTVKIADKDGFISETADRDYVWLVKTPQAFLADMYRAAAYTAEKEGFEATDDCALCERLGFKIKLVECDPDNIKLTCAGDLARAEDILRRRAENENRTRL